MEKPRIGVYVCSCGTNIARMVDVDAVVEEMMKLPNVVVSKNYKYMCSDPGQDLIIKDIKEHKLNRIVVSACSPRIHEMTFRQTLQNAGINPYLLQMANIREHVSWVHTDALEATDKAMTLVRAAITRVNYHEPLSERSVEINPATLVIGGGISGITAALEIADSGKKVYLIEQSDKLGGHLNDIDLTYPYFDSGSQILESLIKRIEKNKNIDVFFESEVKDIKGFIGNFKTKINKKDGSDTEITFGNIIVAIGLKIFNPDSVLNYGYSKLPDVITSAEFEKMLTSGIIAKKDGTIPKNIVIIHCVGSRNRDYHEYCSRICCSVALKYANQIRSAIPDAFIYDIYADMRTMSKGCEELYSTTSGKKVMFLTFDQENGLPEIKKADQNDNCGMIIRINEKRTRKLLEVPADLVILMVAMEARENAKEISHTVGVSLDKNNLFIEKHPKLDPVATTTNGVYIVGGCHAPKDITDSVSQARAAAARILGVIARGTAQVEVTTAFINPALCSGCQLCLNICPYTAISFNVEKNVSYINEILCQGCGTCVALCRPKAINLLGTTHAQVLAELDGLFLAD